MDEDENEIFYVTNDSAMIYAGSVVIDSDDNTLVAALAVTTSKELMRAITASLATNSTKYLNIRGSKTLPNTPIRSARKGYKRITSNLQDVHALGEVAALLHPLCGNPADYPGNEHCYIVPRAAEQDKYLQTLYERLDLAISWPLHPTWAAYLHNAGQAAGAIKRLDCYGPHWPNAYRVSTRDDDWRQIIITGITDGHISIPTNQNPKLMEAKVTWLG